MVALESKEINMLTAILEKNSYLIHVAEASRVKNLQGMSAHLSHYYHRKCSWFLYSSLCTDSGTAV